MLLPIMIHLQRSARVSGPQQAQDFLTRKDLRLYICCVAMLCQVRCGTSSAPRVRPMYQCIVRHFAAIRSVRLAAQA